MKLSKNVPLSQYSTFKIGGLAEYFATISSIEEAKEALDFAKQKKLPIHILGKGSNTLFPDEGLKGLVIYTRMQQVSIQGANVFAEAGVSFSWLGRKTTKLGLSGLAFATGIPASVGGAVVMNAGANGQETKTCLERVLFLSLDGTVCWLHKDQMQLTYRSSCFQTMPGLVLAAEFLLEQVPQQDRESLQRDTLEAISYRKATQPYNLPSCGCAFQNPKEASAGRLIEEAGLKGFQLGGACVSTKHANFIVNLGSATQSDVLQLMQHIERVVLEKKGVQLKKELHVISPF